MIEPDREELHLALQRRFDALQAQLNAAAPEDHARLHIEAKRLTREMLELLERGRSMDQR